MLYALCSGSFDLRCEGVVIIIYITHISLATPNDSAVSQPDVL